jgi:hypothetical protein
MTNKEIVKALNKYSKLNRELLNYTEEFHDSIFYDIHGYWQTIKHGDSPIQYGFEKIDTQALENQIKSVQHLIKGYKLFNVTYA